MNDHLKKNKVLRFIRHGKRNRFNEAQCQVSKI